MFLHHSSVAVFYLLLASKCQNMLAYYETCFTSVCSLFLRHCQFTSMSWKCRVLKQPVDRQYSVYIYIQLSFRQRIYFIISLMIPLYLLYRWPFRLSQPIKYMKVFHVNNKSSFSVQKDFLIRPP